MRFAAKASARDMSLTAAAIAVLAAALLGWHSISFRHTLVLFAFFVVFATERLCKTPRRLLIVITATVIVSAVVVGMQVHETLVLHGSFTVLVGKFVHQLENPLLRAWLIFLSILAWRYVLVRYIRLRPETKSMIEGFCITTAAVAVYAASLSARCPVHLRGGVYTLSVANGVLLIMSAVCAYGIFRGERLVFFDAALARANVAAVIALSGAALFMFALIRAYHGGSVGSTGRLIRTILGIAVFALLVNDRASTERNRRILKSAYTVITGALLVVAWICRLKLYRYIPRFDLFG